MWINSIILVIVLSICMTYIVKTLTIFLFINTNIVPSTFFKTVIKFAHTILNKQRESICIFSNSYATIVFYVSMIVFQTPFSLIFFLSLDFIYFTLTSILHRTLTFLEMWYQHNRGVDLEKIWQQYSLKHIIGQSQLSKDYYLEISTNHNTSLIFKCYFFFSIYHISKCN